MLEVGVWWKWVGRERERKEDMKLNAAEEAKPFATFSVHFTKAEDTPQG